jgi:hypothetical protein
VGLDRRTFLGLGVGLALEGALARAAASPSTRRTLEAFLDTLIPADATPSAGQLGVTDTILARAAADARYRGLIERGCAWLDAQSKGLGAADFAGLGPGQRDSLVAQAAGEDAPLEAQMFFVEIRDDAFLHYYARPDVWRELGYAGPPQPAGFVDHARPPAARPGGADGR